MARVTINLDAEQFIGLNEAELGVCYNSIHDNLIVSGEQNTKFSCAGSGCHVTAGTRRVRGDKSRITGCGADVVYQARIWKWRYVRLAIKEHTSWNTQYYSTEHMLTRSGLIKHKFLSFSRSSDVFQ